MQMMAVEMVMKVMGICYDDDGAQKNTGWKNQHGDKIHIYAHYACMKEK